MHLQYIKAPRKAATGLGAFFLKSLFIICLTGAPNGIQMHVPRLGKQGHCAVHDKKCFVFITMRGVLSRAVTQRGISLEYSLIPIIKQAIDGYFVYI